MAPTVPKDHLAIAAVRVGNVYLFLIVTVAAGLVTLPVWSIPMGVALAADPPGLVFQCRSVGRPAPGRVSG
jgi:Asp-tRNA(Asn)/Glu-tRNA(Gln) amidotransferase A subunit family amidase